jgi:hypothetical protein
MINLHHPDSPHFASDHSRPKPFSAKFPRFESVRTLALWFAAGIGVVFMVWMGVLVWLGRFAK